MKKTRRWEAGGLIGLLLIGPAMAQERGAPTDRAQRDAGNPIRLILEAAGFQRDRKEPVPSASSTVTPASPRKAAAPVVVGTSAPSPAPTRPKEPAPAMHAAPAASLAQTPSPVLTAALPVAPALVAPTPELPAIEPRPDPLPTAVATLPAEPPPLEILDMPPPQWRDSMAERAAQLGAVRARIQVRADGTVSQVQLDDPRLGNLAKPLSAAVKQWRFKPPGMTREQDIQLVLNDS